MEREIDHVIRNLLRKVYFAARKLKLQEFEDWVNHEWNGYKDLDKIPDYRLLRGELKAWNPDHGWISVINYYTSNFYGTVSETPIQQATTNSEQQKRE